VQREVTEEVLGGEWEFTVEVSEVGWEVSADV
jgi:hypothetical protein